MCVGFWDFIAPDFDSFRDVVAPVLPDYTFVGPLVLSADDLVSAAWLSPGSGIGLATRVYYEADRLGVGKPAAQLIQTALDQQGSAGEFGDGAGFGGSFGWRSERTMAALVIPNVYRVALEGSSGGRPVTNVIGVRGTASGQAEAVATAVQASWATGANRALLVLPAAYSLQQVVATDLSSLDGQIAIVPSTGIGQLNENIATNGACALVKWGGGSRSRSSRGRLYFGPLTDPQVNADGRTLSPAALAGINAAMTKLRADLDTAGFDLCVISQTLGTATNVSTHSVESVIATQRRRIRG